MDVEQIARAKRLPPATTRRALRVAAGFTLEEIAALIGVTRQAVAKWETGDRTPRGERRTAYGKVLEDLRRVIAEGSE